MDINANWTVQLETEFGQPSLNGQLAKTDI